MIIVPDEIIFHIVQMDNIIHIVFNILLNILVTQLRSHF